MSARASFQAPPLDGSLTIPEIWDWHYLHNPDCLVFSYGSAPNDFTYLTYSTIVPAAHEAGMFLLGAIGSSAESPVKPRIAIIATSDTVTFFCTLLGAMMAGICTAIISPYNSPAAVAHLLSEVDASYVFVSTETSIQSLVQNALDILAESTEPRNKTTLKMVHMPTFKEILPTPPTFKLAASQPFSWFTDRDSPVVYTHTSGSTSLPKPLPWNHAFLLQVGFAPIDGYHNFANQLFAWHGVSMSHGTGVHLLSWIPSSGYAVAVFPPQSPAKPFTTDAAWEGFVQSAPDYVVLFPQVLEEWSKDPLKVKTLKTVKGVVWLGGFLNRDIGDELAKEGVQLYPLYGMAEAGVLGSFLPPNQGLDWEYFSMTPRSGAVFRPVSDDIHELILVQSPTRPLAVTNTDYLGSKAYATKDLFQSHPSKDGFWKPVGRMDDLIVLSNGKKVNPLPIENVLNRDPRIRRALVFGEGRPRCGALIDLFPEHAFDLGDLPQADDMKLILSNLIETANATVAGESKLHRQMILFTHQDKPFQYTEKGSVRRGHILEVYKSEIDALFDQPDSSSL